MLFPLGVGGELTLTVDKPPLFTNKSCNLLYWKTNMGPDLISIRDPLIRTIGG